MFKVSVVVPVYNTENYIRGCLDSILNQTLQELEVILIDDGSTDRSLEIMQYYQKREPDRIRLLTQENAGQGAARNRAIPLCRGEYIGFVDSDDTIHPEMYERMYQAAKAEHADYVECDYRNVRINERGQTEPMEHYGSRVRHYTSVKDMLIDPMVAPWNKLYRTELLQGSRVRFPEGLIYEDTSFYLKSVSLVKRFAFVPEQYVQHYNRGASTMNANRSRRVADIFAVLEDVILYYRQEGLFEQYHQELEYEIVKILLCSSMQRIAEVPDRRLRQELCSRTWNMIEQEFPNYRENPYLKQRSGKTIYMKLVRRWNLGFWNAGMRIGKANLLSVLLLLICLVGMLFLTVFSRESGSRSGIELNPFHGWFDSGYDHQQMRIFSELNLLLFVPFGWIVSMFQRVREAPDDIQLISVGMSSFLVSMMIELTQLLLECGFYETQDLIMNTLGGISGWVLFRVGVYLRQEWKKGVK